MKTDQTMSEEQNRAWCRNILWLIGFKLGKSFLYAIMNKSTQLH